MEYICTGDKNESTIKVVGDLTFDDHTDWREMFELILEGHPKKIILDLQELVTFDSAALGLILIFQAKAVNEKTEFEILQPETGYLKYALNCTEITCVPGIECGTKPCPSIEQPPEHIPENEAASTGYMDAGLDKELMLRLKNWASLFGPLKVS